VARLLSSLAGIAEARLRSTARRVRLRAVLIGGCVVAGLLAAGFGLAAATVALAQRLGALPALGIMAGAALLLLLVLMAALAIEARRHRTTAAARERLDRQLYRTAALAALPRSRHGLTRTTVGLALVALGAFIVLRRRD
jgi:hypothetical protein